MTVCPHRPDAVALIRGGSDFPDLWGEVRFYQKTKGVWVVAHIYGLPKNAGFLGFHIHKGSHCAGADFAETDGHFDPKGVKHPDHAGDLPPLLSYGGEAYQAVLTGRFRVADVLGRTVVIHQNPDDFYSQPSGNAGRRIACGEIK